MPKTLSEFESKQLLAGYGVPVPEERLAETPENIAHKTERNLVRLGLDSETAVRAAAVELLAAARPEDGDVQALVAPMISGRRELIAGVIVDPQFGPCVMLGLGGIFAEALEDVAFAVAPLDDIDAQELISALENQKLLGAFRGEPAVDRSSLAKQLLGLSAIAEQRPDVLSIDLNPLIICDGQPVIVDALVELAEGDA